LVVDVQNSVRSGFNLKYLVPSVWNSLPVSVRETEHLQNFEKRLKEYLLGNYFFIWEGIEVGYRAGGRIELKGLGSREKYLDEGCYPGGI